MNILVLSDYFYPHIGGGVEGVVREVGRRLVERGHAVHLVTLKVMGAPACEWLDGMTIHRAPAVSLTRLLGLQSTVSLAALPLALRVARELQPDLIHAHNLFFMTTPLAIVLKRLLRRPLVTTLHLGALSHLGGLTQLAVTLYERSIGRTILRQSDRVIAVSQAVADHGRRLAPGAAIRVIPNGVDSYRFRPAPNGAPPAGRRRIALVGRLIFNKGPHYLIDAAPAILARHPDVEFLIVGDGPLRASLEAAVARRGLARSFAFLGLRPDVPELLQSATMLVRPSLSEGLPLTVLEAMACALPVVATPVGGTAEVVRDGQTGYLVPPGAVPSLAEAICRLLDNPEQARQFGLQGRRLIEQEHSWERVVDQTLGLYGELVPASTAVGIAAD
jgi:glycosyltransferase involved in cell wall biosynthesis